MRVCGIIAEYNPFHLGHLHHLRETRRILGEDTALVCVMSGNFVQRGDFAIVEKYDRAAAAVECGADLVLELPLTAALSSAEAFARGGVAVLRALGAVDALSFGAECADVALLKRAAALRRSEALRPALRAGLREGLSYPAAVQRAMAGIDPEAAALLSSPNNTLALAYLAAVAEQGAPFEAVPIARAGAAHDGEAPSGGLASASYVRAALIEGRPYADYLPAGIHRRLRSAMEVGRAPMRAANCETALLGQLRRLDREALSVYAPSRDGLAARLHAAIAEGVTFDGICAAAQTRRYPLARVRRALLRAYLDLPAELPVEPQYLRVLALGSRGSALLREAALPVIVKPTAERGLAPACQALLAHDALADELYALAAPSAAARRGGQHWTRTPYVQK